MRPSVLRLLSVLAIVAVASPARGQVRAPDPGAVLLRWDSCWGDGGADSRSFACDSNAGSDVLVFSAISQNAIPDLNGAIVSLAIVPAGGVLPSWWSFEAGQCRHLVPPVVIIDTHAPTNAEQCFDPWASLAPSSIAPAALTPSAPGGIAYDITCALPGTGTVAVPGGQELFLVRMTVTHGGTAGAGACAGCLTGCCLGVSRVRLTRPGSESALTLVGGLPGTHGDTVGWQTSGDALSGVLALSDTYGYYTDFTTCSTSTEAHRPTWSQVKRLYR